MSFESDTMYLFFAIFEGILKGSAVGLFGYVFIHILIKPNAVFDFWTPMVHKKLDMSKTRRWKIKADFMLNHCEKCFAGQLALWFYIADYKSFFALMTCVSVAILSAQYLYKKTNQ